jgi:hypothetical protein
MQHACQKYVMKKDVNLGYMGQLSTALYMETIMYFCIYLVDITPKFKMFLSSCILNR